MEILELLVGLAVDHFAAFVVVCLLVGILAIWELRLAISNRVQNGKTQDQIRKRAVNETLRRRND